MYAYIIRRLLLIIPTLFLVTIVAFSMARFIPGDVVEAIMLEAGPAWLGTLEEQEAIKEEIEHQLGLDLPIHVQYGHWIWGVVQGDLGASLRTGYPITGELVVRLPVTLEIGILGFAVALLIAIPIGVYSAIRQDTAGDYLGRSFAIACVALPSFWLGTIVITFPSIWWNWMPPVVLIPFTEDPVGNLVQFILPATILGMYLSGTTMRLTRTMMLEVLRQDYIRTAWSKGLRERTIVFRHALKNALIPVVTLIGIQLPVLIGGSVVIEQIFALPGMGILLLEALYDRDYAVISGLNLVIAFAVLTFNLVVDLTYGALDPRVQFK